MGVLENIGSIIGSVSNYISAGSMIIGDGYYIGYVPIDTFVKVDHKSTSSITKYPVETGAYYADNIIVEPAQITVTGVIKDDIMADVGAAGLVASLATQGMGIPVSKSSSSWQMLRLLQTTRQSIMINAGMEIYSNMVITNLTATKDKSTCRSLHFVATLTEMLTASGQVSTKETVIEADPIKHSSSGAKINKSSLSTADRAAKKVSGGMKKPISGMKESTRSKTLLKGWLS